MFERGISTDDVRQVTELGEVIREYADDTPYPSRLILGWIGGCPLHVVAADNQWTTKSLSLLHTGLMQPCGKQILSAGKGKADALCRL
jgi:hypothetical protein